jgi:membrane protease YdiL (CAAX protease family)
MTMGYAFGAGYLATRKISSPILIHGLVDTLWLTLFAAIH